MKQAMLEGGYGQAILHGRLTFGVTVSLGKGATIWQHTYPSAALSFEPGLPGGSTSNGLLFVGKKSLEKFQKISS